MPRAPKPQPTPAPSQDAKPDRRLTAVRVMAALSAALAVMCVYLAHAWQVERETAACWRVAAEFQRTPDGGCGG